MRLASGLHRGRRLQAPAGFDTRPTADRARQALFNILRSADGVTGKVVLDAFAGSGAMGLEALSQGAARAYFIETDRAALTAIDANIRALGEADRAWVVPADATLPPPAPEPCRLAFLDPPYRSGLAGPALAALAGRGWLAPEALAVVEVAAKEPFVPPEGFAVLDERVYGAARLVFCRMARIRAAPLP